jgi:hypothetical protein
VSAFRESRTGRALQIAVIAGLTLAVPARWLWQPLLVAGAAALFAGWRRLSLNALGLARPSVPLWRWVAEGVIVGSMWQFIVSGLVVPLLNLWLVVPPSAGAAGDWGNLLSGVFIFGFLHVLAKGFAYRAFLLPELEAVIGASRFGTTAAFLVATLLFGLSTAQSTPTGLVIALAAGAVFNALYYAARRNAWPTLIAHSVYNITAFGLAFVGLL